MDTLVTTSEGRGFPKAADLMKINYLLEEMAVRWWLWHGALPSARVERGSAHGGIRSHLPSPINPPQDKGLLPQKATREVQILFDPSPTISHSFWANQNSYYLQDHPMRPSYCTLPSNILYVILDWRIPPVWNPFHIGTIQFYSNHSLFNHRFCGLSYFGKITKH